MEKTEVKTISYIELNEAFKKKAKKDKLKDIHINLYNELFSAFNREFWPKCLKISNNELIESLNIKHEKQFRRIRETLINKGYIFYNSGTNKRDAGVYELVALHKGSIKVSEKLNGETLRDLKDYGNGDFESVRKTLKMSEKVSEKVSDKLKAETLRDTRDTRNGKFERSEKVSEKVSASYKTIKTIKTKKNIYNKLYILKKDFFTSAFMCLDINKNKLKIKDLIKILKSNNKNLECNNKTDNTLITITNKTEDTTKKKEKGKSKQKKDITKQLYKLINEYTENEELKEILRQRVQHKKELNKHFTITSFKLFIKELDKIKDDDKKIEAINISISKNWQGFRSTWIDNLNNNTFTNTKIKEKISNINNIQTFKKTKEYEEKVMQEAIERGKEYIRKLEENSEYIGDISKVTSYDFDEKGQMIGLDKNKKPVYWEIFKNIKT